MEAIFKCQACKQIFGQNLDLYGMMADKCPTCKSVYVDCQNLEKCLKWCEEKDEQERTYRNS